MRDSPVKILKNNSKRLKTILWILFPVLFIGSIILLIAEIGPAFIGLIMLLIALTDLMVLYALAEKYFNWPMISVLIFLLGVFFKGRHWPLAGTLLTTGVVFLILTSLFNAIRFQLTMKGNPFLRWFGSISCIVISTYMCGWLIMVQHWPKEIGDIFGYIGIVLFVISILGMVFTLPRSNYIGWGVIEKKIFYRSIFIPLTIVFCLIIITLVFSEAFIWIMDRNGPPLELENNVKLFDLEGIRKL